MKKTLFLLMTLICAGVNAQTTVFSENIDTPTSPPVAIGSHTFQNTGLTFIGNAFVDDLTPSNNTGASGAGYVDFVNVSDSFQISSINTAGKKNLSLSFNINKTTTGSTGSELEVSTSSNGTTYTSLTLSLPTGTGTAVWQNTTVTGSIPATSNLRLKYKKITTGTDFSLDDIVLTGCDTISPPTITGVTYTAADSTGHVTFTAPTSGASSITGYRVIAEKPNGDKDTWYIAGTASPINISDADGYKTFKLSAYSGCDTSEQSTVFSTVNPLPVTWAAIEAGHTDGGNRVDWSTASEKNTDYFLVEYSQDAISWQVASDKVMAAGNSADMRYYSWLHTDNITKTYYRIKQVDLDGKYEFSKIVYANKSASSISNTASQVIAIYPNPSNGWFTVETSSIEPAEMVVTNMIGKRVFTKHVSYGDIIDLRESLPCGVYLTQIGEQKIKLVIQ